MRIASKKSGIPVLPLLLSTLLVALAPAASLRAAVEEVVVTVEGMACPFCAYGIEKRLRTVEGAGSVEVDMESGEATVHAAEGASIALARIPAAVRSAGFTPGATEATARGRIDLADPDRPLLRVSGTDQELLLVNLSGEERSRIEELAGSGAEVRVRGPVHTHEEAPPAIEPTTLETVEPAEPESPGSDS